MKTKEELKILENVYDYMRDKYVDPQMGIGETTFEEIILFTYKLGKTSAEDKE